MIQQAKKYSLILGSIILIAWTIASIRHVLLHKTNFQNIEIESTLTFTPENEIQEKIKTFQNEKLFLIDLALLKNRLEDLPYIKSASIQCNAPNTLKIKIIEYQPVALYIADEDKTYPIARDGTIIPDNALLDLPLVTTKKSIKKTPELLTLLENYPFIRKQLSALEWIGNRRWNIHFEDTVIMLSENPEKSLDQLQTILKKQSNLTGTIDLRDPKRTFVK